MQDIEVDGPFPEQPQLSRVSASVALPAQMRALAELAEQTRAIIVVCEPEPVEPGDGGWSIASVSHRAVMIGVDMFDGENDSRPLRSVELHQFAGGNLAQTVGGYVDYRPTMWRDVTLALRR